MSHTSFMMHRYQTGTYQSARLAYSVIRKEHKSFSGGQPWNIRIAYIPTGLVLVCMLTEWFGVPRMFWGAFLRHRNLQERSASEFLILIRKKNRSSFQVVEHGASAMSTCRMLWFWLASGACGPTSHTTVMLNSYKTATYQKGQLANFPIQR